MSAPIIAKTPRHPANGLVWAFVAIAAAFVAVGAWMLAMGNVIGGIGAFLIGAYAFWFGRMLGGQIVGVQQTNTAVQQLMRGDLAATVATLDAIPARAARSGNVRRGIATLRAMVALYEGRLEESVKFSSSAIEGRRGFLTRAEEGPQIAAAHGVRALARAALGDAAGAKLDADAAETSVDATPEVIARARLVRAILASRVVYHEEAFRAYLAANARLVLEHAMPRERALFRALRRMSRGPERSVYREQGRKKDDQAPSKLAGWIAFVAPEAAAFVEGDRMLAERAADDEIPSGVPSDVRAIRTARATAMPLARSAHRRRRVTIGIVSLMAMVAIVWRALAPSTTATMPPVAEEPLGPSSWTYDAFVLLFPLALATIAWTAIMALRARRRRTLALARRLFATGNATTDRARAKATLAQLASSGDGLVAATAGLELARIAATEADFAEAIARCDAAIARVSKQPLRANASDILLPSLMTESAVAMAARGGLEDADAELAILCRDFPTYPRLSSSLLRVRLVRAMRGGDRNAACAIARSRTADLPLPYREDVLAELALVSRAEATEDDLARLAAELQDDSELCAWLDAVAPGLRDDRALVAAGARLAAKAISIPPIGPSVRPPAAATSDPPARDAEQTDEITSEDAAEKRVVTNS